MPYQTITVSPATTRGLFFPITPRLHLHVMYQAAAGGVPERYMLRVVDFTNPAAPAAVTQTYVMSAADVTAANFAASYFTWPITNTYFGMPLGQGKVALVMGNSARVFKYDAGTGEVYFLKAVTLSQSLVGNPINSSVLTNWSGNNATIGGVLNIGIVYDHATDTFNTIPSQLNIGTFGYAVKVPDGGGWLVFGTTSGNDIRNTNSWINTPSGSSPIARHVSEDLTSSTIFTANTHLTTVRTIIPFNATHYFIVDRTAAYLYTFTGTLVKTITFDFTLTFLPTDGWAIDENTLILIRRINTGQVRWAAVKDVGGGVGVLAPQGEQSFGTSLTGAVPMGIHSWAAPIFNFTNTNSLKQELYQTSPSALTLHTLTEPVP